MPYTLWKHDTILSKLKARIRKTSHKYGIEIPKSVKHANEIDIRNSNTFCVDAIAKDMTEVGIAFKVLEDGNVASINWKKFTGHLVWGFKMDFTRKARWVLNGHKTRDPIGSTYAGVVSRKSAHMAHYE